MKTRKAFTGGGINKFGVHLDVGGETLKLRFGGRVHLFEFHHMWGPSKVNKDGSISAAQWSSTNPIWYEIQRWIGNGMLVDGDGFCITEQCSGCDGEGLK